MDEKEYYERLRAYVNRETNSLLPIDKRRLRERHRDVFTTHCKCHYRDAAVLELREVEMIKAKKITRTKETLPTELSDGAVQS